MKKNFKFTMAATGVAAAVVCMASCGKQKPAKDVADSASVDELVGMVMEAQADSAAAAEGTTADASLFAGMDSYDAKFFAGNSGYTTTKSGLKYVTVVEGTGASPKETDMVTVHYTGRLLDGTVFDSSVQRGEPATFPLTMVIKGWTEGLQLMKTGGKTVFYIPSDLAYGEMGSPGSPIGPNTPLIFEVELISIGQ